MKDAARFRDLALTLERVRGTRGKNDKVQILAEFLKGLEPDEAKFATRMAVGMSSERGSRDEVQVGYSTLLDAIKAVTGATAKQLSAEYLKHGDLGEVAEVLLESKKERPLFDDPLTIRDIEDAFSKLRLAKGKGSGKTREGVVRSLMSRAEPVEGKYVVKVLTREMRTGLVSGMAEEAVGQAFGFSKDDVARAHMLLGDVGLLAEAAAKGQVSQVNMRPFRPVNFMLAESAATPAEAAEHFGRPVLAELKYDGVRAQIHKFRSEVRVYSRRLEDVTEFFPETVRAASMSSQDFIVDGELVPFADGKPLPFQLLQRRLRRKEGMEEAAAAAPVESFIFDLLLSGKQETTGIPLSERKALLGRIVAGTGLRLAESVVVATPGEIGRQFRKSRELGYEGLVLKDPDSTYGMGKRGSAWVKLKEELDTLDVVIVAAEYGHGKRAGVISDYTFAVRDGNELKTVGKAYSGLTDAEIEEMTAKLKAITLVDRGYSRVVKPEVVLEVAFDSIQQSSRHDSGYALRFPRIKRIRTDKSPDQIDTLSRVEEAFRRQKIKLEDEA